MVRASRPVPLSRVAVWDYRRDMSEQYMHGHHASVLASHAWRTAENSAAYLLDYLEPGMDVLDVGCGVGTITTDLAMRVPGGRVVGMDLASEPLDRAADYAVARGVENVEFEQADVYALPYAAGSFDVVHAHQLLQHLKDPIEAIREMKRVLRRGGLLALREADYGAMTWFPESGLTGWRDLYQQLSARHGAQAQAGRRLLAWVRAAGFTTYEPSASTWCFAEPDDRAYWGNMWIDRMSHSTLAARALEVGLADQADLDRIKAAWADWSQDPDGWFVVVHGEILARA